MKLQIFVPVLETNMKVSNTGTFFNLSITSGSTAVFSDSKTYHDWFTRLSLFSWFSKKINSRESDACRFLMGVLVCFLVGLWTAPMH